MGIMGIMVYALLWVMQDFVHQPYLGHGCSLYDAEPQTLILKILHPEP